MMNKLVVTVLVFVLLGLIPITEFAWALSFGGGGITWNSIHCERIITGISKKIQPDLNIVCKANIKEIIRACRNHGEQADPAKAEKFEVNTTPIQTIGLGTGLKVDKQGKATTDVEITRDAIRAQLGPLVDPALVCPNKNWIVDFAVTKLDVVVELLSGATQPPNQNNQCNVVNVSMDPATACQALDGSTCQQVECLFFEHATAATPISLHQGKILDITPCEKPTLNFDEEMYNCPCDLQGTTGLNGDLSGFTACQDRIDQPIP